jgi:hypothetical protein
MQASPSVTLLMADRHVGELVVTLHVEERQLVKICKGAASLKSLLSSLAMFLMKQNIINDLQIYRIHIPENTIINTKVTFSSWFKHLVAQ